MKTKFDFNEETTVKEGSRGQGCDAQCSPHAGRVARIPGLLLPTGGDGGAVGTPSPRMLSRPPTGLRPIGSERTRRTLERSARDTPLAEHHCASEGHAQDPPVPAPCPWLLPRVRGGPRVTLTVCSCLRCFQGPHPSPGRPYSTAPHGPSRVGSPYHLRRVDPSGAAGAGGSPGVTEAVGASGNCRERQT